MRLLLIISRLVIGITFILSGILKAIDPVGFGLKINEYLKAFNLEFLDYAALPAAVVLCAIEFVIGVYIIQGIKMRFSSTLALWFISFFTLLTLYSALFNPVQDCGCFGEAIHLTNWETFFKNVVLLACALLVWFNRARFAPSARKVWESCCMVGYLAYILAICSYSILFLPPADYGGFDVGTDLLSAVQHHQEMEYETTFIYSKDDQELEFTLDNLPDSTWTFVEANTKLISASSTIGKPVDFVLKNGMGEYVTEKVLESPYPIFFVSIYSPDKLSSYNIEQIALLRDSIIYNGGVFYFLSGSAPEMTEDESEAQEDADLGILYTDYKTALLLNRSNGGAVYVKDGIITGKWGTYNYPIQQMHGLLEEDSELIIASNSTKERIFIELSLLAVAIMIIIGRLFNKKM